MKQQRYHFTDKGPYNQSYGFSSSNVQMWELYHNSGAGEDGGKKNSTTIVVGIYTGAVSMEKSVEFP